MRREEHDSPKPFFKSMTNTDQSRRVRGIVIAGTSGGSGKSMAAIGLIAALVRAGAVVVPFKKGPDYIDAGWLGQAAGRPCYNLDPFLMGEEALAASFHGHLQGADHAVVEGNRGLYDGVGAEAGFSTADLAVRLDLPVLLVVNCSKTTRTVAALVLGCRELDRRVRLAGVILNQIATARHERIVRESVERYTDVPVVGVIPRQKRDPFPMRHLGVIPHQEYGGESPVARLADLVAGHFDLDRIRAIMGTCPVTPGTATAPSVPGLTIGILRDQAFQFYYEENLEALRTGGARLVEIDALRGAALPPELDALYIGGGFPETSAGRLADNVAFRESVRVAALSGLPIYAECGGLIFLGRSIVLDGREYPLAGVFPVTFGLSKKPQAHGYSIFRVEGDNAFYPTGAVLKGHEFRYSTVDQYGDDPAGLVLAMERGAGFMAGRDGLRRANVLALYTHILASATPEWAAGLLVAAARHRRGRD